MEFKIDTKKRIRIFREVLVKIWYEQNNSAHEFSAFIKSFSTECGLLNTSVIAKNSALYAPKRRKETYLFKIVDKQKFFLAKIKYGL